jgi:hypothetical protein
MRYWSQLVAAAALLLAWVSPAHAAWFEATSPHFVVYSDQSAEDVRAFAQRLEKFDQAVRLVRNMNDPKRSPATKVSVYIVPSISKAGELANMSGAAGFYRAIVEGPMAVVPRERAKSDHQIEPEAILFHEYAHHLLLSDLSQPIPLWLSEGFAEFFSTAEFNSDGSVKLGSVPEHRLMTFRYGQYLPLETMLAGKAEGDQIVTLYALGWLLTHYLTFEESRRGQLQAYLADIAAGMDSKKAAEKNFGSLRKLNAEVNGYLKRISRPALEIEAGVLKPVSVQVRQLGPGAAAVMPWRIESKSGVTPTEAPRVLAEVRRVAQRYPNDPLVLLTLAEAEIDAKNAAASEAAADRLLAIDADNVDAMVFKGRAIMARAKDATGAAKSDAFSDARSWFIRANKVDKEDPEPLAYYYRSYKDQGIEPTANAARAIHYASNLMPQDGSVRMLSVLQFARDGQTEEAREALVPLAYSGHNGGGKVVKEIMEKLKAGDAKGAVAVAEEAEKKAKEEAEG